jgi:hypothetical protein
MVAHSAHGRVLLMQAHAQNHLLAPARILAQETDGETTIHASVYNMKITCINLKPMRARQEALPLQHDSHQQLVQAAHCIPAQIAHA